VLEASFSAADVEPLQKAARLFLISDILHNSSTTSVRHAANFRKWFAFFSENSPKTHDMCAQPGGAAARHICSAERHIQRHFWPVASRAISRLFGCCLFGQSI
jgi:hypothetical protein